ncbi:MAG: SH3 domain-containing protein, partial [Pyrinomonadaceae bacterium]
LVTDSNLRGEPNKNSASVGIHFKDAKVKILAETSYEVNGTVSIWYKVRVTDYGCSKDTSLGCGKNSPNDADEGWVNAKVVLLN